MLNWWGETEKALVLTLDGAGDGYSSTVNLLEDGNFTTLAKTNLYSSLGWLYARITQYLGMKPASHEYKVMGLAAYGKEEYYQRVYKTFKRDYFRLSPRNMLTFENLSGCWGIDYFKKFQASFGMERFDNIAAGLQRFLEDLVLGSRFIEKTKNIPLLNSIGNTLFSLLTSYISGVAISDGQTGYRAFKKEMFEKFDVNAKSLEFETKMTAKVAKLGYTICEVPIEYRARIGQSKLSPIYDGCKMFSSIVSIAISETSLLAKVMILPSIFFVFLGLYFGIVSTFQKIRYGVVKHDFYPLLTAFFILLAIQLISFGLLIDNLTKKLDRIEGKFRKN